MKKLFVILFAVIMLLSVVACDKKPATPDPSQTGGSSEPGQTDPPSAIRREVLTLAIQAEPQTLDTYAASHDTTSIAAEAMTESLLKNVDGQLVPWLAKDYEIVDDTTLVFHLRDDVYLHDGNKMTADDVVFSLVYGAESNFTSPLFGAIDTEKTKAVDEYTVEIKLQYPFAPILEAIASYRGAIISKAAFETMGADAFGRAPVGTGPMKFKQWVEGDRIELEYFEQYWGEKPAFDSMNIRIILESSSRAIELETGGVDIAFMLSPTDWDRIADNPGTQMLTGNSLGMTYLCFNNSQEPYNDINLRKAIAYAINVEAVAKTAYQGQADAADGFIARSIPGWKSGGPWEYNPEKSRQLLAEAGYEEGFEVKFITFQQQYYNACIEIIQSMLGEVGIKCTIDMVDLATFTTMNNGGELPMTVMANSATIMDPSSALIAWPLARTISLRHNDQHIEDLLNEGVSYYDMEERIPVYEELQDYLWEKLYLLPLAYPINGYGASASITNLDFVPTGIPDFAQIQFSN